MDIAPTHHPHRPQRCVSPLFMLSKSTWGMRQSWRPCTHAGQQHNNILTYPSKDVVWADTHFMLGHAGGATTSGTRSCRWTHDLIVTHAHTHLSTQAAPAHASLSGTPNYVPSSGVSMVKRTVWVSPPRSWVQHRTEYSIKSQGVTSLFMDICWVM